MFDRELFYKELEEKKEVRMGVVHSNKGFFIGDPGYVIHPHKRWMEVLESCNYFNHLYESKDGFKIIAHGTMYGDGYYPGGDGRHYSVDAGLIGIVPLELVDRDKSESDLKELGRVVKGNGEAGLEYDDNGVFYITIKIAGDTEKYEIETGNTEDEDDYEDDCEDDCDEEEEEE